MPFQQHFYHARGLVQDRRFRNGFPLALPGIDVASCPDSSLCAVRSYQLRCQHHSTSPSPAPTSSPSVLPSTVKSAVRVPESEIKRWRWTFDGNAKSLVDGEKYVLVILLAMGIIEVTSTVGIALHRSGGDSNDDG